MAINSTRRTLLWRDGIRYQPGEQIPQDLADALMTAEEVVAESILSEVAEGEVVMMLFPAQSRNS